MNEREAWRNRRATPRQGPRGKVRVDCRRAAVEGGASLAGALLDVSERGVCLLLRSAVATGQEVDLLLEGFGSLRRVRARGRVVWCRSLPDGAWRLGVRLDERLSRADLTTLC
jgi:hypothetical protein